MTDFCKRSNDDRLGRVLAKLYSAGLTQVFVTIALEAARKFGVKMASLHLDSSSFHVHGEYDTRKQPTQEEPTAIEITHGYSRDYRPDLKQLIVDLMCSGDGDLPLYLRVADGNESDCAMRAQMLNDFRQQWQVDALFVADAALYSKENLPQMHSLRWLSRVPATNKTAQLLLESISEEALVTSQIAGYKIAECCSNYGGVQQRWLVVESETRQEADRKQFEKRLLKQQEKAQSELWQLSQQQFACAADAMKAAKRFERQLHFHQLAELEIIQRSHHAKSGRPRKDTQPTHCCYLVDHHYDFDKQSKIGETEEKLETPMPEKYIVNLNTEEQEYLYQLTHKGKCAARMFKRAQILLLADEGHTDETIAQMLHVGESTVHRTRQKCVNGGVEIALKEAFRPGGQRKLDGRAEAMLIATACSDAPTGQKRWTMQMLADRKSGTTTSG